jgi:integrase
LSKLAGSDKPEKFIMPGMADKGPGGRHGLSESFKAIMHKAGVDAQRVERKIGVRTLSRRTFHALRHSFTSALANAGVAPELRMKLTGHTTETAHRGYRIESSSPIAVLSALAATKHWQVGIIEKNEGELQV